MTIARYSFLVGINVCVCLWGKNRMNKQKYCSSVPTAKKSARELVSRV